MTDKRWKIFKSALVALSGYDLAPFQLESGQLQKTVERLILKLWLEKTEENIDTQILRYQYKFFVKNQKFDF